jgi:hypothetical protein
MALYTPLAHKETSPFGRIIGKNLGEGKRGDQKNNNSDNDNGFPHKGPLKTIVRITKLTMQN